MSRKQHKQHKTHRFDKEIPLDTVVYQKGRWFCFSDKSKLDEAKILKDTLKVYSNAIDEITSHLLGKDWYAVTCDSTCFGVVPEIVRAIKWKYKDVNISFGDSVQSFLKKMLK